MRLISTVKRSRLLLSCELVREKPVSEEGGRKKRLKAGEMTPEETADVGEEIRP